MSLFILVLFYLLSPIVILILCHRFPFVNKLGSIVIAYIIGLILGNIGILPEGGNQVQNILSILSIPLALPLLLFSLNIKGWFRIAAKALLSLLLSEVSLVIVLVLGFHFWGKHIDESWKVAGMLAGVYTGGTFNMAAIASALHVKSSAYIITNTCDIIMSSVYMLFLMTVAQRFFNLFLPKYVPYGCLYDEQVNGNGNDPYAGIFTKRYFFPLLRALGIAVLIASIGFGLTFLVPHSYSTTVAILTITTLGILASLIPSVNKIEKTFETGMYFILVFSVVVASMANFKDLTLSNSLYLLYYVSFAIFGTLTCHVILARVFKVDTDTVIITSTAVINSPPFVPLVAASLKNREIIISGLTVGIIGYAIGNYIGILVAYLLR